MADSSAPTTDTGVVKLVVIMLGALAAIGMCGMIYLLDQDKPGEAIAVIGTLTGAALGGLAGLLANTRSVDLSGLAQLGREREEGLAMLANAARGADRIEAPTGGSTLSPNVLGGGGGGAWKRIDFGAPIRQEPIIPAPADYQPSAPSALLDPPPVRVDWAQGNTNSAMAEWTEYRNGTLQPLIEESAPIAPEPGARPIYDTDGVTFLGWELPSPYPTLHDEREPEAVAAVEGPPPSGWSLVGDEWRHAGGS